VLKGVGGGERTLRVASTDCNTFGRGPDGKGGRNTIHIPATMKFTEGLERKHAIFRARQRASQTEETTALSGK